MVCQSGLPLQNGWGMGVAGLRPAFGSDQDQQAQWLDDLAALIQDANIEAMVIQQWQRCAAAGHAHDRHSLQPFPPLPLNSGLELQRAILQTDSILAFPVGRPQTLCTVILSVVSQAWPLVSQCSNYCGEFHQTDRVRRNWRSARLLKIAKHHRRTAMH